MRSVSAASSTSLRAITVPSGRRTSTSVAARSWITTGLGGGMSSLGGSVRECWAVPPSKSTRTESSPTGTRTWFLSWPRGGLGSTASSWRGWVSSLIGTSVRDVGPARLQLLVLGVQRVGVLALLRLGGVVGVVHLDAEAVLVRLARLDGDVDEAHQAVVDRRLLDLLGLLAAGDVVQVLAVG